MRLSEIIHKNNQVSDALASTSDQFNTVYGIFNAIKSETKNFKVSADLVYDLDEISAIHSQLGIALISLQDDENPNLSNMMNMVKFLMSYLKVHYE